ncbi:MAG: succinylglutamate desuccinylase/aspartoacylase family protein [Phycisphaerales bacterium]|nr:MAG: succinylglutamate desuccinylase/aspartoacylase family protein [Phycisphaerales bacterium]
MYTGEPIYLPIRVIRAKKPGPRVFLTAAVHGDEVNGTGIIRQFVFERPVALKRGALICVPVVNIFGFETHDRYLPDRRDLNRSFPGSAQGSLASRLARTIMTEVVRQCDYGIDLHSAAEKRTNYPNVRGNLRDPAVRELAEAFGCELLVNGRGPEGSLRRAACDAGCHTIILEAGEIGKIEPAVLKVGVRGVQNVLIHLQMMDGTVNPPLYQTKVFKTTWVRAELGGLLRFHVAPGDLVRAGQPLATNESVFGDARSILISPADGIVLGMTTHPAVKPGEPVCHIARPGKRLSLIRKALAHEGEKSPAARVRDDLATSIAVSPIKSS